MQLHNIQSRHKAKSAKRVGRGGKRGSFSGRGIKGQKARSGRKIRPEIRDLIMKIPKSRGHRHTGPRKNEIGIAAAHIAKKFKPGEIISPKRLFERGLIKKIGGRLPEIKILSPKNFLENRVVKGCRIAGIK